MTNIKTNSCEVLPYSVTLWGSHPDAGNDDCWTGADFATREEAIDCFCALRDGDGGQLAKGCGSWEFANIDGPDAHETCANPDQRSVRAHRREAARSDRDWQREQAMQAGMAFGCDGYNDAMGY